VAVEQSLELTVSAFVDAVTRSSCRDLCALLDGEARLMQGCGTVNEDVGPFLTLAVHSQSDVKIVRAGLDQATATFPDFRPTPGGPPDVENPGVQVMNLRKLSGVWKIVEFQFRGP